MEVPRMIRSLRFAAIAGMMALSLAGGSAFAQGPGPGGRGRGPGGPGGPGGLPLRQLELTDAQQQQVRDVMQKHRDETRGMMERLQKAQAAQFKAVDTLPVNE